MLLILKKHEYITLPQSEGKTETIGSADIYTSLTLSGQQLFSHTMTIKSDLGMIHIIRPLLSLNNSQHS